MDVEQYIDIFLDESREHLQQLNECLLSFESDMENLDTINEIFRIAHTLKGMSATMGFNRISKLTHKMEDVFDGIRSHKITATEDIVDVLFEGFDILDSQIKYIEENGKESDVDVSEVIRKLDDIENGKSISSGSKETSSSDESAKEDTKEQNLEESKKFGGELTMPSADKEALFSAVKGFDGTGNSLYRVDVVIDKDSLLKSARAYLIVKNLEEVGEIVYSIPPVQEIEEEKFDNIITMLYLSKHTKDEIVAKIMHISEIENVYVELYDINYLAKDASETQDSKQTDKKEKEETVQISKNVVKKNAPKAEKTETKSKSRSGKVVRVDIDRLDNLMNLVSELIIVKTRLEDKDIFEKHQNLTDAIEYLERITTSLHDAVTKVRMVPIERVFNRFPRMIRDLSKELKKEINLVMEGEETEVDRTVIDEIGDPLIHMLRNSIDHGIETPIERIKKGKNEKGTVNLIAYPDGNTVVIEVKDDGAGINIEKVKGKAIEKGMVTQAQADEMEDEKIAEFIMAPGFSTADHVTNVSGRGVGLDVVKTKIESLNGVVEIQTKKDKGSAFIIRLPLTLAIIQALMVVVGGEKYAIPLNNIKEITDLKTEEFRIVEGKEIILYRGNTLPLLRISDIFDCKESEDVQNTDSVTVVIVRKGDKELGLIVDSLIGQQEIVIKSLGAYLNFVKQIAGATILGNGSVALIIDTNSLF